MANDKLHRISWKAGEITAHGTTRKHFLHVLAEHLMQDDANLVKIEEIVDDRKRTSDAESDWPPKEVAPIRSRFDEK